MEYFSYEDFSAISECIGAVDRAIANKEQKVSILGESVRLHKDAKVYLSFVSLSN